MKDSDLAESMVCQLCYAYTVDSYSPTHLAKGNKIFEIEGDEHISVSTNETVDMKLQYSDSNYTASHHAADSMKVGAHFKAFSGAASMAVETTGESKYHTVRVDAIGVCTKTCITTRGTFRTHPQNHLTEDFKTSVKDLSVEDIASRIGVFYAIKLELGGMVKRTYVMEATEEDNESKITAELQSAFGKECLGASLDATASFESGRGSSNKVAKVRHEWRAQGGETDLWFKVGATGAEEQSEVSTATDIAREWAKTIDSTNEYPFDFELRPVWELIQCVDKDKAREFKSYLEDKWEKEGNRHMPSIFLPTKLRIVQIPEASKTFILNTCRAHEAALVEQSAHAQRHLDNPIHFVDRKRYKRLRESADSGMEEVLEIRDIVCNDLDMKVEELIEKLECQSQRRFLESRRYLGLWGNDSKNSNKVQKLNKAVLDKIIKRLNIDLNRHEAVEDWHNDLDECQHEVYEAMEWFGDNLDCMESDEKRQNITRAVEQVKDIQGALVGFLTRLENELEGVDTN